MDESIRKQLEKPQTWFCKYFPKRIQNVGEKEIADRQLVYDFKDGRSHEAVAQMTAARMIEEHGSRCSQLVFIPVPASSVRKKEIRKVSIIEFDEEWFRGKAVIVFDDVITRGISFGMYANQLESFGANVIEGIFLARTHYKV